MSEIQKPVSEPVVAPATSSTVPETTPVVESKPVESAVPVTEETPATTESAKEETAPVNEEVKPVEEGVLGYKGPGLLKGLIFQKKFFWFGTEPVEQKHLGSYLRGEKPEVANHNTAWASSTGKGLLFFSKKAAERATPSHVFNLSEITDLTEEGTVDFFFNQGGHKYTFQATSLAERDNWVSTLKTKITEAKEIGETIKDNEDYKKTHTALTKPVTAAVVAPPKKSAEIKKEDKVEAVKEEKKEDKLEVKEEKKEEKTRKSRSASRKRNSIFGSIGFGKKEEKSDTKEAKEAALPTSEDAPVEPATAPAEVVAPTPVVESTPAATEPAVETRPTPNKRNSIFDSFKNSFAHKEPKEKKPDTEAAPIAPAKETEPVSENAPVIPAVESTEPLQTSTASPATVPTDTIVAPVTNGEAKVEKAETPVVKSDKRKSSLPWLSSTKKEKATSDEEGEKKPTSPFAKFRATVKGKASPKTEKATEKVVDTESAKDEDKKDETPVTETVKTEPSPVAATTPQVAATA